MLDRLTSECDLVFHLAAAVGVELIVRQPVHTIETNVMGTEAVLRTAARYRARVLIASTSEVYGKGSRVPFNEADDVLLGPTNKSRWAYAASKMVDEFLGLAYYQEQGLPVTIMRFFNTIGPRQTGRYGMVIPRLVAQALAGQPLTVYGDGQQSRCFCDVADVVRAALALVARPETAGEVFNIGVLFPQAPPADADPRIQFVAYADAYAPGFEDMRRRVPDTSKLRALTGWAPAIPLPETIRRVADTLGRQAPISERVRA